MELTVKLEAFEGPLDLLLHLLDKNKVSIYDIPIVEITAQYLDYIRKMQQQDLNIMSEFLVMASTLIAIKSKMLLPKETGQDEDEGDPREELVQQLLEYKMYKCMSYELKDRQVDAQRILFKMPTVPAEVLAYEIPVDLNELMSGLTLHKLKNIFQSVMRRQEDKIDRVRAGFGKIEKEEVSLSEKMEYLEAYAVSHKKFRFRNLLESQHSRMEVIVCFLAVLELIKMGKIQVTQDSLFDEIEIESKVAVQA